jgi:hypothetical protein
LGATDLGSARSVQAFLENSKAVAPIELQIEKRAEGTESLGIFRVIVAIQLAGSTDLVWARSVAPNTLGVEGDTSPDARES